MAVDNQRYRQLKFIGAKILQERELNWLQDIDQGVSVADNETSVSGDLQSLYRQGAMKNVTVSISGLVVSLSATDGTKPMEIFVRDRWEVYPHSNDDVTDTLGTFAANHSLTLSGTDTDVFLNWELKIRTGGLTGDDPSLTDAVTNEAVASAGELILHLSNVDTSGVALSVSQLAKNTSPISLLNFTNSGSLLTLVPQDNVVASARASSATSGFVKTTTNNPIVVSTDDSRIGSATVSVADGLVHDSTVRTPVSPGGTNSDGSPVYNFTPDIGGISAAKIILIAGTQLLEDGWNLFKTAFNTLLSRYNAHSTAALGTGPDVHPVPTAAQVGAAPSSHVGQPLNLVTSHPAVCNQDSGGFRVNRSGGGGAVDDPAYGVFVSGSSIVGLNHDGDVYSSAAGVNSVTLGGGLTASGSLDHLSKIAQILRDHVNQQSHANPHGLAASDIGAASLAYVDAGDASTLAAAILADAAGNVLWNRNTNRTGTTHTGTGGAGLIAYFTLTTQMKYFIFRLGSHFELAIGYGSVADQDTMPLPEASGWTTTQAMVHASGQWIQTHYDQDTTAVIACWWDPATNKVTVREHSNGHTPNYLNCFANVFAVFYRNI